jgi:hypothetical protein
MGKWSEISQNNILFVLSSIFSISLVKMLSINVAVCCVILVGRGGKYSGPQTRKFFCWQKEKREGRKKGKEGKGKKEKRREEKEKRREQKE